MFYSWGSPAQRAFAAVTAGFPLIHLGFDGGGVESAEGITDWLDPLIPVNHGGPRVSRERRHMMDPI